MKRIAENKGFTLIELLVAIAILGLVVMAISTTFIGQRREGLTQEDVAEAQQSARIGVETLIRDIRRGGLMLPKTSGTYPIGNAGNFRITVVLSSEEDAYATITNPTDDEGNITGLSSPITFTVDTARDFQSRNGADVMIVRPTDGNEPGAPDAERVCYTVTYLTSTSLLLTLKSSVSLPTGGISEINFKPGDTIYLHNCASPWPVEIQYYIDPDPGTTPCVGGNCGTAVLRNLVRYIDVNGNGIEDAGESAIIASNIVVPDVNGDGIPDDRDGNGRPDNVFRYLDENGNETASLENITSVSIDLTTATTRNVAQLSSQARTRELTSLVRIKNRRL